MPQEQPLHQGGADEEADDGHHSLPDQGLALNEIPRSITGGGACARPTHSTAVECPPMQRIEAQRKARASSVSGTPAADVIKGKQTGAAGDE